MPHRYAWKVSHDFLYYHGVAFTRDGAERAARKRAAKWERDLNSNDNRETFTIGSDRG